MLEGGGVVEHRVVVRDVVVREQVVDVRVFAGDPVDVEALVLERVSGVDAGWAVAARRVEVVDHRVRVVDGIDVAGAVRAG